MNILIIDGQRLFAEGLKNILTAHKWIKNVYLCCNKKEEIDASFVEPVDLVICDLNFSKGLEVINEIKKKLDKPKLLVLSGITDVRVIRQTLKMGVHGFISKNTAIEELMEGIEEVYAGRKFIGKNLRTVLINNLINEEEDLVSDISVKEKEVLVALCEGNTVKEIGLKMGLSTHTINYYQRSLMKKLQVSRTLDLIMFAIKKGIYVYEKDFC